MKLFHKAKDGGPESKVTGYWLIESKRFFSIALLRFDQGSREVMHTHAFNAVSWILWGTLLERTHEECVVLSPSILPVYTARDRLHQVFGVAKTTWALSFRGPWVDRWQEFFPKENKQITLTHGRVVVS